MITQVGRVRPVDEASPRTAVVVGAGGGIGAALVAMLERSGEYGCVHALSRQPGTAARTVLHGSIDVANEDSIAGAAARFRAQTGAQVDLLIIATGMLHEAGRMPERSLREIDGAAMARVFAINSIGPALVLKHFAPLLPKDRRSVVAALSARVGSIGDNRSGGWYSYRASKAALNMIVKSAAIEIARSRPLAICVALHPGTVDTPMSQPFQARVAADALFSPEAAADHLHAVIDRLAPTDSGRVFAWDGSEIEP